MSWWSRVTPAMRGATILVVLGALILATVWGVTSWDPAAEGADDGGETRTVEPGHFTTDDTMLLEQTQDYRTSLAIPGDIIQITVSLAPSMGDYDVIRAPRGGALLEVEAEGAAADAEPISFSQTPSARVSSVDQPTARIGLHAGDFRVPLLKDVSAGDGTRTRHVAIPRADAKLVLELEFDGRRQTVDLRSGHRRTGAFAALYRAPNYDSDYRREDDEVEGFFVEDWTRGASGGRRWFAGAKVEYRRVPYVLGLGWAKQGREWLVIDSAEFRVRNIHDRREGGKRASTEPARVALSKESKGKVGAPGGRVVREPVSTSLSTDPDAFGDKDVAYFHPQNVVIDVPIGSVTRLTFSLRTPLAPPHRGTLRATKQVPIEAPSHETETVR